MKTHEAEKLIETIRSLIESPAKKLDRPHQRMNGEQLEETARIQEAGQAATLERAAGDGAMTTGGARWQPFTDADLEKLYQQFKNRFIEEATIDPVLLHLLTIRPEIVVEVERKVVNLEAGDNLRGRVARLIAAGFLSEKRKAKHISDELARSGSAPAGNRLAEALDWLKKAGFLICEVDGWIAAPGVKVTERNIASA